MPLATGLLVVLAMTGVHASGEEQSEQGDLPGCPFGVIEGPDPIGYKDCLSAPREDANREGEPGRARPGIGFHPRSGAPFVVWAEPNAGDHDVAFLEWDGAAWGGVRFLTSTTADERDPRAFAAEDGTILVAWWTAGDEPEVFLARRDAATADWSDPERVAGPGRRPTVAVAGGRVWVVYERAEKEGRGEVLAVEFGEEGRASSQVVAAVDGPGPLEPVVRAEAGRLWIEWRSSDRELTWARRVDGRWVEGGKVDWTDPSWSGERAAREAIRAEVLSH